MKSRINNVLDRVVGHFREAVERSLEEEAQDGDLSVDVEDDGDEEKEQEEEESWSSEEEDDVSSDDMGHRTSQFTLLNALLFLLGSFEEGYLLYR